MITEQHERGVGGFIKKPVAVRAMRYRGPDDIVNAKTFCGHWLSVAEISQRLLITTPEGAMEVKPGDWIIRGTKGEFYPCKDDVFRDVYRPVETAPETQAAAANPIIAEQAPPKPASGDVWLLVVGDMEARRQHGIEKYGVPVQVDNGRDPLVDAYQEALDLVVYLRQEIERRKRSQT